MYFGQVRSRTIKLIETISILHNYCVSLLFIYNIAGERPHNKKILFILLHNTLVTCKCGSNNFILCSPLRNSIRIRQNLKCHCNRRPWIAWHDHSSKPNLQIYYSLFRDLTKQVDFPSKWGFLEQSASTWQNYQNHVQLNQSFCQRE